jgi:hypothetical protein
VWAVPLKEAVGRDDAAAILERILPEAGLENIVRPGVERQPLGEREAPIHQLEVAVAVIVREDDWLHDAGRDVLAGHEVEVVEADPHLKGLGDLLFI